MTKTLFLFELHPESLCLFELEGDHRRFDGVIISAVGDDKDLQDELAALIYDGDTGEFKPTKLKEPTRDWTYFVKCGFYL